MLPESDAEYETFVDRAMKEKSKWGDKAREVLGNPENVDRTVAVLVRFVDRIDEHLQRPCDEVMLRRRESARDRMFDCLVWYETLQRMHAADADE